MLRAKNAYFGVLLLSPLAALAAGVGCSNTGNNPGTGGVANNTGGNNTGTGGVANNTGGNNTGTGGVASNTGGNNTGGVANNTGGTGDGGSSPGDGGSGTGGTPGGGGVVPGTARFDCGDATGTVPALQASQVGSGIEGPMVVAFEPNTTADRLFVLEVTGVIKIIEDGTTLGTPFLDFSSKVGVNASPGAGGDERGALGFAFHPDYATNGLFYVHYSDGASQTGDSVLEEYHVSTDPNVAETTGRVVHKVTQPSHGGSLRNHKGGAIAFGADGFLYWGLGDGGGSGDAMGNGQSLNTMLGKILRINPVESGSDPYTSPSGNLAGGIPELWDYGLRNPFRFTFDGCTGDLYIGDVGQNLHEEIDIEKRDEGHKNYGWNSTEGLSCYEPMSGCDETGVTDPVLDYPRTDGQSVTGGAVYRGASIPELRGTYFYADYQANKIWSIKYDRDAGTISAITSHTSDLNNVTKVVGIHNGPDGEIYFSAIDTGVFKLEAAP